MLWNSILLMTIIDLLIISATVCLVIVFIKHSFATNQLGLSLGTSPILFGLGVISLFYLFDLFTMTVLPLISSHDHAMQIMNDLHSNWSWFVALISVLSIAIGFGYLVKTLIPRVFASSELLEHKVQERTAEIMAINAQLRQEIAVREDTENTLKKREEQYRTIIETTREWVWEIDKERIITFSNQLLGEILGYRVEELLNRDVCDFMLAEDKDTFLRAWTGNVRKKCGWKDMKVRWQHKNGSIRFLESSANPVLDNSGELLGYRGANRDITARQQAERELRDAELRSRTLLEGSPICHKIIDLDSRLLYMSTAGVKQLKISDIRPFYGCTYPPDFYPESMRAPLIEHLERAKAGEISSLESPVLDMDGDEVWFHTTFVPARDDEDRIQYIIATSVNITERKNAESALYAHNKSLGLLSQITAAANVAIDVDDTILTCLEEICEFSGWPVGHAYKLADTRSEKLVSTNLWCLEDPVKFQKFRKIMEMTTFPRGVGLPGRVLDSREPVWIADITRDPNIPVAKMSHTLGVKSGFAFPIMVDMKVAAVFEFYAEDVIEPSEQLVKIMTHVGKHIGEVFHRKQTEEKIEQSHQNLRNLMTRLEDIREKERIGIAHEIHDELGQTLTGLKLDLAWLKNKLPIKSRKLHERVTAMLSLIDPSINTVRSICSKLRPPVLDDIGLEAAIECSIKELNRRTDIACDYDLNLKNANALMSDNTKTVIYRIFQEAITNICRHSSADHVCITLSEHENHIEMIIKDNGVGINEDILDDSMSLGLLGVKERARANGGDVVIMNQDTGGVQLIATLPIYRN